MDWAWLVDIGRELIRILGTIFGVLVGAKIAFSNASKGRREDILFKERYKVFEYMELIFKDVQLNYKSVQEKRRIVILNWISDSASSNHNQNLPNDEDKLQLLSELREDCFMFHHNHVSRFNDFRVETMFSKDLEARINYTSEVIYDYMLETQRLVSFIEETMRNPPTNLIEIKREKKKEWKYSDGYDKPGSSINMIYRAMFSELKLPTDHPIKVMSLEEFKTYVFDPGLVLTVTLPDGRQVSSKDED